MQNVDDFKIPKCYQVTITIDQFLGLSSSSKRGAVLRMALKIRKGTALSITFAPVQDRYLNDPTQ